MPSDTSKPCIPQSDPVPHPPQVTASKPPLYTPPSFTPFHPILPMYPPVVFSPPSSSAAATTTPFSHVTLSVFNTLISKKASHVVDLLHLFDYNSETEHKVNPFLF